MTRSAAKSNGARRPGPGRPATPLISREAAAIAALDLIDRDGLTALSVQAVASAMNVKAPSLYHHFRDKDDLLQLVALELLRQIGETARPELAWEARVLELAIATRRVIVAHAEAAPLLLRFFPRRLLLGAYERTLRDCPFPARQHIVILEAIEKLTYGNALYAAAAVAQESTAMPDFAAEWYPALAQAQRLAPGDEEQVFVESLRALLEGFHARYDEKEMADDA